MAATPPSRVLSHPTSHFTVCHTPTKGLAIFAHRPIRAGTRILSEAPLLVILNTEYLAQDVDKEFAKLSEADKKKVWSLASAHGQDESKWPKGGAHPSCDAREKKR